MHLVAKEEPELLCRREAYPAEEGAGTIHGTGGDFVHVHRLYFGNENFFRQRRESFDAQR
jgi:hypothetical protein